MSCGHSHLIPLPLVGDQSQTSRLADELAMAIHLGAMRPGAPLREVELANTHGVSRTIVRAALQRLESQGLVEIALNKGARVRVADPDSVTDMIDLHAELTALAARRAAQRANPSNIAVIRQFVDMMEHVAEEAGTAEEFQHLRIGFARALFEAAGPVLAERLRSAAPVVPHHARAMDDIRNGAGQEAAARLSRDVLTAISSKDLDLAARAAERLVRGPVVSRPPVAPVRTARRTKSAA